MGLKTAPKRSAVDDLFDALPDEDADQTFASLDDGVAPVPGDAPPRAMPQIHGGVGGQTDTEGRPEDVGYGPPTTDKNGLATPGTAVHREPVTGHGFAGAQGEQGASFGYQEELGGLASAVIPQLAPKPTAAEQAVNEDLGEPSFMEWISRNYTKGRDSGRNVRDIAKHEHPFDYGTGMTAGTLGSGAALAYGTGGASLTPAGGGLVGYLAALGHSDAPLSSKENQEAAENAAVIGTVTGGAAGAFPKATGAVLGTAGVGLGLFGDKLGMDDADRVTAAEGGGLALLGAGTQAYAGAKGKGADIAKGRAMRAFDEAMEGRKSTASKAESKLQDLGDEKAVKLNAKAKGLEAEREAELVAGRQKDEAVAMKAAADQQAKIERANEKFQRILRDEAKLAGQSKSGQQKYEAAKAKALAKLEAELNGLAEQEAAAGRSKEGAIGRGYQSDYAADHQYGDVPDEALAPAALERRKHLAGKKADVANRRYQEPLPEDRAKQEFEEAMKGIAAKREALQKQIEQAKAPTSPDAPNAMPEYALPGELVPRERIDAIAKDLGLDARGYDPRSYKGLPLLGRGDDDKTGAGGFVSYSGDRRIPQPAGMSPFEDTHASQPKTPVSRQGVVDSPEKIAREAKDAAQLFKLQRGIDNQMKTVQSAKAAATPEAIKSEGAKALQLYKDQQQVNSIPDAARALNPFAAPSGALKDPAARYAHFSALAEKLGGKPKLAKYVPMLENAAVMSNMASAMKIYEAVMADPEVQKEVSQQ